MQNVNFIMGQFPKQSRWKEYPHENNKNATKVWENVAQTRIGGEFWACDAIAHKTYWNWGMDVHDQTTKKKTVQQRTAEGTATRHNNGITGGTQCTNHTRCSWYKWCRMISRPHCLKKTSSKQSKSRDLHLKWLHRSMIVLAPIICK